MPNAIYALGYGVSSRAVLFIINFIAVKLLIPGEYGIFSYFLGIVASIATLSSFGAGIAINTTVARHKTSDQDFTRKVIYSSLVLSSILALLLGLTLVPLLDVLGKFGEKQTWSIYAIALTLIWLISFNGISEGSLNGAGAYKKLATNGVITFLITVPAAWALTELYGFLGAIFSIVIYRLILATLNAYRMHCAGLLKLRQPLSVVFEKPIRDVFTGISLPSVLSAMMVAPVSALAMRLVAEQPGGLEDLAYFSWVYQIYLIAVFAPSTMGGYFITRFSQKQSSSHDFYKILKINFIISCFVVAVLFLIKPYILIIAGTQYIEKAGEIFNILIPTVILYSVNSAFASYWPSKNKAWFGLIVNSIWAIIVVFGTWLNVKKLGGLSLAYAFMGSYTTLIAIQLSVANYLSKK